MAKFSVGEIVIVMSEDHPELNGTEIEIVRVFDAGDGTAYMTDPLNPNKVWKRYKKPNT